MDPKNALAHNNLGLRLNEKHQYDEAIAILRKAIELDPKNAYAHNNLGWALNGKERYDEAIPILRKTIELNHKLAAAYSNLGWRINGNGRYDAAIPILRQAIELQADRAAAHGHLRLALRQEGRFAEALQSAKRYRELLKPDDPRRQRSAQLLEQSEQMVKLDGKLPAILRGEVKPVDDSELTMVAEICQDRKLYTSSARFWRDAFHSKPELAEDLKTGHRYNAACAAARAATSQGGDAAKLDQKERTRWHQQARQWLRADLALWTKQVERDRPESHAEVQQTLGHWQRAPDFAGVHDPDALAKLSEEDRKEWRQVWADVEGLLSRADSQK